MPYLNHNEKASCENCGTQTTQFNLARHRKRCSVVSTICSSCTNFSTKSRAEMNYRLARKHSKPTARKCKISDKDFNSFYKLPEQKRKEHGAWRGTGAQSVDVAQLMGDVDDNSLKEKVETCKKILVVIEMKNGRHRVYNFTMDTLDPNYLLCLTVSNVQLS